MLMVTLVVWAVMVIGAVVVVVVVVVVLVVVVVTGEVNGVSILGGLKKNTYENVDKEGFFQ